MLKKIYLKQLAGIVFVLLFSEKSFAFWLDAEYLYGRVQNSPVGVPLITQNSNPAALGLINEPGTQIIFGAGSNNNSLNLGGLNGGKLTIGSWLGHSAVFGLEGSVFKFSEGNGSFSASSVGGQPAIINIPFFDILNSRENVLVDHHPNTVSINDNFRTWGFELNGLYNLNPQLVLITGFRHINFSENFILNDAILELPGFLNSVVNVRDNFATYNNFYGIQFGARSNIVWHKLFLNLTGLVAAGENFEKLNISGETNLNNIQVFQPIGIFSEFSNIGSHRHNEYAIVPEIRAKLGYQITKNLRPYISYDYLYINNIIRPGKQIDRNINLSQNPAFGPGVLSGPPAPQVRFNNSGMWMQNFGVGLEFSF